MLFNSNLTNLEKNPTKKSQNLKLSQNINNKKFQKSSNPRIWRRKKSIRNRRKKSEDVKKKHQKSRNLKGWKNRRKKILFLVANRILEKWGSTMCAEKFELYKKSFTNKSQSQGSWRVRSWHKKLFSESGPCWMNQSVQSVPSVQSVQSVQYVQSVQFLQFVQYAQSIQSVKSV